MSGDEARSNGRLSVLPDHMTRDELLEIMQAGNRFLLQTEHGEVFEFKKRADA